MSYRTAPATHSGASYDASPAVPPSSDPLAAMAAQLTPKRAVSYIRVSTREQAQRGGSEEGPAGSAGGQQEEGRLHGCAGGQGVRRPW